MADPEIQLVGGNVNLGEVVRIGNTVRRPLGPHSDAVHAVLRHLDRVGFEGAPRFLGVDEQGREVLSWIEGEAVGPQGSPDLDGVRVGAALLRETHDALASFDVDPLRGWFSGANDPAGGDQLVHGDFAPWNLIAGSARWFVIDWDMVRPGRRIWDISYALHTIAWLWPGPPAWQTAPMTAKDAADRIEAFATGYGMDDNLLRSAVLLLPERTESIATGTERLAAEGHPSFIRLAEDGHPQAWRDASTFTASNVTAWLDALGLA